MRRIVYCPSELNIAVAEEIAKQSGLSIQVGDSQATETMLFDRTVAQIIDVPTEHEMTFLHAYLLGECAWVNIVSDWNDFLINDVSLNINNKITIYPQIKEKHYVRFIYNPEKRGVYKFKAICADKKIFDGEISVM